MSHETQPLAADHRFIFKPDENVQGGGCHVDVWLPEVSSEAAPVALFFHGGGFWFGSSMLVPLNQVRYLLDHGVVVVSAAYRYRPHASLEDIQEDVLDAYKYLQGGLNDDLSAAGSPTKVDPHRCCTFGWSMGGTGVVYLAAKIAEHNRTSPEKLPPLKGMVPTYPWTDFAYSASSSGQTDWRVFQKAVEDDPHLLQARTTLLQQKASTEYLAPIPFNQDIKTLVERDGLDRWARWIYESAAGNMHALAHEICGSGPPDYVPGTSPIDMVSSEFPPTMVVVAQLDTLLPPELHSYKLVARLIRDGVEAQSVVCRGMGHGWAEGGPWALAEWESQADVWWDEAIRPSLDWALSKLQ